ncbi:MAG: hypothetical protein JWN98_1241, partial [Abditibacteriota bacterium]|nr:hypothetical protein [Abditibacteriota bacterium]
MWLLGRLLLPLSRRLFPNLPDGGLAAGRIAWLAAATLLGFWGASLYTLPLWLSPLWLLGGPLLIFALTWRDANARAEFGDWTHRNRRALQVSDAVFMATYAFFLWIRLRNPALSDLEKPMDAALMSAASRATFLPFDNPWLAGVPFTNYYYFGPLMGGLLLRAFATPVFEGYNLVQPLFCALFVSTLWSLGAAVTNNLWRGAAVASIVALLGHFEPLRQMSEAGKRLGISEINWWTTSRVVPDTNQTTGQIARGADGAPIFTINEYPLFTLSIGDAHAHFYALSLAALLFCLCWSLFSPQSVQSTLGRWPHRRWVLLALGALLGTIISTNTWDAPFYALLVLLCAVVTLHLHHTKYFEGAPRLTDWLWCAAPVILAPVVALPYLFSFRSPIKGIVRELWVPPMNGFLLFWGGFLALSVIAFVTFCLSHRSKLKDADGMTPLFLGLLWLCGFGALLSPSLFYINGFFGGDMRHQDT